MTEATGKDATKTFSANKHFVIKQALLLSAQ